jgi:hypothetical protein
MKDGKRPTKKQKIIMQQNKMDDDMWLVTKVLVDRLECVHRHIKDKKDAFYKVPVI